MLNPKQRDKVADLIVRLERGYPQQVVFRSKLRALSALRSLICPPPGTNHDGLSLELTAELRLAELHECMQVNLLLHQGIEVMEATADIFVTKE